MKPSIMPAETKFQGLMQYLGSAHSRNTAEGNRAADSFAEMFNSMVNRSDSSYRNTDYTMKEFRSDNTIERSVETEDYSRGKTTDKKADSGTEITAEKHVNSDSDTDYKEKKTETGDETQSVENKEKSAKTKAGNKEGDEENMEAIAAQLETLRTLLEKLSQNRKSDPSDDAALKQKMQDILSSLKTKLDAQLETSPDKGLQKKLASLKQLLLKLQEQLQEVSTKKIDTQLVAQLKSSIKQFQESDDAASRASRYRQNVEVKEDIKNEHTDSKLTNTVKPETESRDTSGQSKPGGNSFSFNENESTRIQKSFAKAHTHNTAKGGLFREQVQDLIQRSRMVLQDRQNGTISLKMYPERLGNVSVNLGLENGTLTGRFLVESQEAKDVLLANMQQLRERLEEEGISFGEFQVNVRDNQSHFTHNGQQGEHTAPLEYMDQKTESAAYEYNYTSEYSHAGSLNMVI